MEGLGAFAQGFGSASGPSLASAPQVGFQARATTRRLNIEEAESKRKSEEHMKNMELLSKQLEAEGIRLKLLPQTPQEQEAYRKAELEGKLAGTRKTIAEAGTAEGALASQLPPPETQAFTRRQLEAGIASQGAGTEYTQEQLAALKDKRASELMPDELRAIARENARLELESKQQGVSMGELQMEEMRDKLASQVPPGELRAFARRRLGAEALAAETGIKLTREQITALQNKRLSELSPDELRYFARRSLMAEVKGKEAGTKLTEQQTLTAQQQRESMLEPKRAKELAEQGLVTGIARERAQTDELEQRIASMPPPELAKRLMARSMAAKAKGDEEQAKILEQQAVTETERAKESIRMGLPSEVARRERLATLDEENKKAQGALTRLQMQGVSTENTVAEKKLLDMFRGADPEMAKQVLASGAQSLDGYRGMYFEVNKRLPTQEEEAEYLETYRTSMLSLATIGKANMNDPAIATLYEDWRDKLMEGIATGDMSKAESYKNALFKAAQLSQDKATAATSRPTGGLTKKVKLTPEWGEIAKRAGVPITPTTSDADLVYEPKFRDEMEKSTGQKFYRHQGGEVYILPKNKGNDTEQRLGKTFDEFMTEGAYGEVYSEFLRTNNLTPSPETLAKFKEASIAKAVELGGRGALHEAMYKVAGKQYDPGLHLFGK